MRCAALLVVAVLAAGCTPDPVAVGTGWLAAPASVTVGPVPLGESGQAAAIFTNTGTGTAEVIGRVADGPFDVPGVTILVEAGAAGELLVSFAAEALGPPVQGRLVLALPDGSEFDVPLVGLVTGDGDGDGVDRPEAGGADCDDHDPNRAPGLPERCNGVDDDCSGVIDDVPDPPGWFADVDRDGVGAGAPIPACEAPPGTVAVDGDCDDADADRFPGNPEVWYDGTDQDCDGRDDDQDADGFPRADDCDDVDAAISPAAEEVWYDGTDQDCDGIDDDQDADGAALAVDCDDTDPARLPGAPELDDGLDQDCDGFVDEGLWAVGTLRITEILEDPAAVGDDLGRFVEVHNASDGDVDLSDLVMAVGTTRTPLAFGALRPGDTAVLCVEADPALNGGLPCIGTFAWQPGPALRPVALVVAAGGLVVDRVPLDTFTVPVGASLELAAALPDGTDPASWCAATAPYGAGDLGTPGSPQPSCP